jgi:hypothetical protein
MNKIEIELTQIDGDCTRLNSQLKEIQEKHAFLCDYFGLDKTDEMRDKSEEFFKIF